MLVRQYAYHAMLNSPTRDGDGPSRLSRRVFRQSLLQRVGSKEPGWYWATTGEALTITLPKCILLWAPSKMQLFLGEGHRTPLISLAGDRLAKRQSR